MTEFCEAARKGAAFLDRKEPGWAKRVNLQVLDLGSWEHCVLGQLHGDYDEGLESVGLEPSSHLEPEEWTERYDLRFELGFDLKEFDDFKSPYAALTACWKDEIRARRKTR